MAQGCHPVTGSFVKVEGQRTQLAQSVQHRRTREQEAAREERKVGRLEMVGREGRREREENP